MQPKRFQQAFDKLKQNLPEQGKILDLDYGHGDYTRMFEQLGFEVVALDPQGYAQFEKHPESREMHYLAVSEISLPYRTISAIWAKDVLTTLSKDEFQRYLSQFIDWLEVGGVMHFCLLEGEGYKIVEEHLPTGISTVKQYYYSPIEVELAIQNADGITLDAWYEQQGGKNWIHVIAQRQ